MAKTRVHDLAKEYGIGGHSHDFLDGSRGFVNHDWKGLEFDHYPDHQKITLKWAQVEKYIDLMIQSDRLFPAHAGVIPADAVPFPQLYLHRFSAFSFWAPTAPPWIFSGENGSFLRTIPL